MSENEKLREALEAWSKSIIMSDGEREIPIADIWAGYGGDVQHAAKLTREALSTPPSKADADDVERKLAAAEARLAEAVEVIWRMMPRNLNLNNAAWPDETVIPVDFTLGELRRAARFIQETERG